MLPCKQGQLAFSFISMINQVLEFAFLERTYPFDGDQYAVHDAKNFSRLHLVTYSCGE